MSLSTTISGSMPAGGWKVPVACIAAIATPTASAAAQGEGPASLSAMRPTTVQTKCPPTSARGWATSASGEPITATIEVANGTTIRGNAERVDRTSIRAMAAAPPAAPMQRVAIRRRSIMGHDGKT
jgi:hypothetical protein